MTMLEVLIIIAFATGVVQPIGVRGCSMSPTYQDGDILISIHHFRSFPDISRGDVVTLYADSDEDLLLIKRIVGLPGDELVAEDDVLMVMVLSTIPFRALETGLSPSPAGLRFASAIIEAIRMTAAILVRFRFLRFFQL